MEEKTALEHLDDLPEPIRSQAIAEARRQDISTLFEYCHSLSSALTMAFIWGQSPQGSAYWSGVLHTLVIESL